MPLNVTHKIVKIVNFMLYTLYHDKKYDALKEKKKDTALEFASVSP